MEKQGLIFGDGVPCWRRHNCRSQVIDLSLSALRLLLYEINYWVFQNTKLHAIISTSLIITGNLQ
jgi:hypothetical protein